MRTRPSTAVHPEGQEVDSRCCLVSNALDTGMLKTTYFCYNAFLLNIYFCSSLI